MNNVVKILSILFLVILIYGFFYYGLRHSAAVQQFAINYGGFMLKNVINLDQKINNSFPESASEERLMLLNEVDSFIEKSVKGNAFSTQPYLLIKKRLDQAMNQIAKEQIADGEIKLWYLYNMGIILKSKNKTIAFDLPDTSKYVNSADFTKYIDVLIITHLHGDHFNSSIVEKALQRGVTVIVPEDKNIEKYNFDFKNLIIAKQSEKIIAKGVEVTGFLAKHNGNNAIPIDWFLVNFEGKTLLHTGDGVNFDYQPELVNKKIDVLMAHFDDDRVAENIAKFVPNVKLVLPLHILELGHGKEILSYMMYKNSLDGFENGYWKYNSSARYIPLIWGENLTIK